MCVCVCVCVHCTAENSTFCCVDDFLEEHRQLLEGRLQPITREITDTRARSKDELEGIDSNRPTCTDLYMCSVAAVQVCIGR